MQRGEGGHELGRGNHVTAAPARHRIGLGEAVEHERSIGELEDGVLRSLVGEPVIDLVGDDPRTEARQRRHPIRRQHRPGGIGGRVDENGPRPRGERRRHRLRPELEPVGFVDVHVDGLRLRVLHELRVAGVVRVGEDDLVAALQQRAEEQEHGGRGAGGDQDAVRGHLHAVPRPVVLGDGLAQRENAQGVGVAGAAVLQRPLGRRADHRRGLEVGLAELEVDDVDAGPLQRLRALEHLHREKGLDLSGPARDHRVPFPASSRRRRRAAMIWASMRGPSFKTPTLEPAWSVQLTGTSAMR